MINIYRFKKILKKIDAITIRAQAIVMPKSLNAKISDSFK